MNMEHRWSAADKATRGEQALSPPLRSGLGSDPVVRMDDR